MFTFDLTTCLMFALTLMLCLYLTRRPKNLPPGPAPWPIVGNLPMLAKHPTDIHVVFEELAEKYGDMVTLWFGPFPYIIVSNYEKIQKILVQESDTFSGRPNWMYLIQKYGANLGIVLSEGRRWQEVRRMSLRAIRDLGLGKSGLENKIQVEAEFLCEEIAKHVDQPFSCTDLFQRAVNNIICSVCFGQRYEYEDKMLQILIDKITAQFSENAFLNPVNFYPILRFLPFDPFKLKKIDDQIIGMYEFLEEIIEKHKESFDPKQIRHFVDLCILKEQEGHEDTDDGFSRLGMIRTLLDLFGAGTETSSTGLRWLMLYLLHYPDVEDQCRSEVDRVVGPSRLVALADRVDMPYVDATIHEMLRHCNIAPVTLPHNTKEDTDIGGYHIPKNAVILARPAGAHMDDTHWEEPKRFQPERWIGEDGKMLKKEAFIPFSTGPRVCPGESLAKNELFIFFTTLLQRFTFKPVDPENLPAIDGICGITLCPKEYDVILTAR